MKRITRSSSKTAGSNASFRTPIAPLESPYLLSSAFILSALMALLETEDKRSMRLTCRALREAVDPLITRLKVPEDPTALTPVEARAAAKRWPSTRSVTAFSLKELALLADGGTLGAAFPLQELALFFLESCSNRQLASIAHSVRSCPLLTCLELHLLPPGFLPALDPLVDCGTLRSLRLTLSGHVESDSHDVWHPQRLQVLSSLTQLQAIHLGFMHVPGSRDTVEGLCLEGVLEGLTALQELEVGEDFTPVAGSFAALAGCSRLQELSWSRCCDAEVHHLAAASAHLQQLHLYHCEALVNLAGIAMLTSLQRLSLANCINLALDRDVPSGSMHPAFATLLQLTFLDLSGTDTSDVDCLSQLTLLTHLDVADTSIDSLQPLAQLTRLTHLDASNTHIDSLQPLAQLTALRHFGAGGYEHIHDFSPLRRCSRLERLSLRGTNLMTGEEQLFVTAGGDAAPALPCLHYLDVSYAHLPDLSVLSHFTRLQELRMNAVRVAHTGHKARRRVSTTANKLDLSPLSCLTGLTALDLGFCRLRAPPGFTPLLGLSRLRVLRCGGQESEAEACLSSLMELEVLGFDGNASRKLPAL